MTMFNLDFNSNDEIIEFIRNYAPNPYDDGPYDINFIYNILIASVDVFMKHNISIEIIAQNITEDQKESFKEICYFLKKSI